MKNGAAKWAASGCLLCFMVTAGATALPVVNPGFEGRPTSYVSGSTDIFEGGAGATWPTNGKIDPSRQGVYLTPAGWLGNYSGSGITVVRDPWSALYPDTTYGSITNGTMYVGGEIAAANKDGAAGTGMLGPVTAGHVGTGLGPDARLYQRLAGTTYQEGKTYELTVAVGRQNSQTSFAGYYLELRYPGAAWAGTVGWAWCNPFGAAAPMVAGITSAEIPSADRFGFAYDTTGATPGLSQWYDITLSFTVPAGSPAIGQDIVLSFGRGRGAKEVDFDNVRLEEVTVSTAHPGDANRDGMVDLQDFGLLKDNFGATEGAAWEQGDFNGDFGIDLQDFGILKDHFGHTSGDNPVTAVPEPATLGLFSLAACGFARYRRR